MKRFTYNNDEFTCEVCGHKNPPAPATCRNHCRACLNSKHVDINPGDRAENCHGIFKPIGVDLKGDGTMDRIVFKCQKCDKLGHNKIAEDDDRDKLLDILEKQIIA